MHRTVFGYLSLISLRHTCYCLLAGLQKVDFLLDSEDLKTSKFCTKILLFPAESEKKEGL